MKYIGQVKDLILGTKWPEEDVSELIAKKVKHGEHVEKLYTGDFYRESMKAKKKRYLDYIMNAFKKGDIFLIF
jgi:hypothetical protein